MIVLSRWAIMSAVVLLELIAMFSFIAFSVLTSNDDVASSRTNINGCFNKALAMAILCLSPPDNFKPRSPTGVFSPSGNCLIKVSSCVIWIIFSISASLQLKVP
jgi:hypothetical protein